jgi:hypothetical protein
MFNLGEQRCGTWLMAVSMLFSKPNFEAAVVLSIHLIMDRSLSSQLVWATVKDASHVTVNL